VWYISSMSSYGQFCPVAKASEIFAERWTPLILRELLMGSHRFNELERGLPRISRSLLSQRLRSLESVGLVERRLGASGQTPEYHLTQAGQDLLDVIVRLGEWSARWFNPLINLDDLDPQLLMWDIKRRLNADRLPLKQVVVQFDFRGARTGSYWLVLEPGNPSVCWEPPGFDVDLVVDTDTLALHRVWLGHQTLANAVTCGDLVLDGPRDLTRAFPDWLALSTFASVQPAPGTRVAASG
jgi:DNA-binding HxlR family transcriptional regulator